MGGCVRLKLFQVFPDILHGFDFNTVSVSHTDNPLYVSNTVPPQRVRRYCARIERKRAQIAGDSATSRNGFKRLSGKHLLILYTSQLWINERR